MKWTVAICTWNGATRIATTFDSMLRMVRKDDIAWELLVIDNNSTDNTRDVCQRYVGQLPIRIVVESKQGHSFSRNCALENARGDFIAWTDDDVGVDRNWLAAYDQAVNEFPEMDFWGGRIKPRFEGRIPKWISENWDVCAGVYAERELGDQRLEIETPEQFPYGANFVTRRKVQMRFQFDSKFGRVGCGVRGFDEIDVLLRMVAAGCRGAWIPEASLDHLIPQSRTKVKYISEYFQGQGETWVERGITSLTLKQIGAQLRHHQIRFWLNRLFSSTRWFPHLVQASNLCGQRNGMLRQSEQKR